MYRSLLSKNRVRLNKRKQKQKKKYLKIKRKCIKTAFLTNSTYKK